MKKLSAFLLSAIIVFGSVLVYASEPDVKASSVIVASLESPQIVYSKNPDEKVYPGEFTKLMTAYTAYRVYGMDKTIEITDKLSDYKNTLETNMGLKTGEKIPVSSLIYGMLMGQANDAAYALAINYGSIESFVERMNGFAKVLNMENTSFKNPTGNYSENQYTTANDLAKLYRECYKNKQLYECMAQKSVTLPATNLTQNRTYWTKNHLMSRYIYLEYLYDYADAGISSVSSKGGYGVISSASKGTKNMFCIVLDSVYENGVNYSMVDAKNLFDYSFDKFSTVTITKQGDLLYEAKLKNQRGKDTLLLDADATLKGLILDEDSVENIEKEVVIDEPLKAPVKKGDTVGKIVYTYRNNPVGEVNLVSERDVGRGIFRTVISGIAWFFSLKAVRFLVLSVLCIIIVFAVLVVNTVNKDKKRRKRKRK